MAIQPAQFVVEHKTPNGSFAQDGQPVATKVEADQKMATLKTQNTAAEYRVRQL